jgi:hypothetical protein
VKRFIPVVVLLLAGWSWSAEDEGGSKPLEPYDAISLPRELRVRLMDPWAPLEAISTTNEPKIPPQMRVRDFADAFDVLAPPDDSVDPKFEEERRTGDIRGSGHFRCAVLMYHGFHDPPRTLYEISSYDFAEQCRFLADSGIEVIPLSTLVDALTTRQYSMVPDRCVVITVDDGYQNFYSAARPILKQYGFPATICIYTNFIGGGKIALSWEEIREMSGEGWLEVASHSLTHPNLAKSSGRFPTYSEWLSREIVGSGNIIQNHLNVPVKVFSYPYGTYNSSADAVVRHSSYEGALTVHPGPTDMDTDPFLLPRYGIYRSCTISKFARFVQGGSVDAEYLQFVSDDAMGQEKQPGTSN